MKARRRPSTRTTFSDLTKGSRFDPPAGYVSFEGAVLESIDFRGSRWDVLDSTGGAFIACDFSDAHFGYASLGSLKKQTTFLNCRFDAADLRNVRPGNVRFDNCDFSGAQIEDWRCFLSEFISCRFAGRVAHVLFSGRPWGPGADQLRPPRATNEFRDNDFRRAELVDCGFVHGVDMSVQAMPVDDAYIQLDRAQGRIAGARKLIMDWPDEGDRRHARVMLDVYSSSGYEDQDQLFARRDDLDVVPPTIRDRVWSLLQRAEERPR